MSWDPVWEEIFQNNEWGKYPGEDVIRFVARNFYSAPNRSEVKILEMGCGPGANLWYMAREGFNITGVEGSETAVAKANQRLDKEVPHWQGEVIQGDVTHMHYQDNSFDAVLDIGVTPANSFTASQQIFAEASRVLKPGGKLYSRCLAVGCWGDGTGEQLAKNTFHVAVGPLQGKGLIRFTDKEDISTLLPEQLEVVSIELLTYGSEHETIKEWMITATKKQA